MLKTETFKVVTEFENAPAARASMINFKEILCGEPEELLEGENLRVTLKEKSNQGCLVAVDRSHHKDRQ